MLGARSGDTITYCHRTAECMWHVPCRALLNELTYTADLYLLQTPLLTFEQSQHISSVGLYGYAVNSQSRAVTSITFTVKYYKCKTL
jgi:hypothetical protein